MWHCQAALLLQAEDSKDAKEIAAILAEENVQLVPEEDKDKVQELDSLTGQPRATDILLYAIPVRPSDANHILINCYLQPLITLGDMSCCSESRFKDEEPQYCLNP